MNTLFNRGTKLTSVHGDPFAEWKALDDSWIEFPEGCENLIRCNPNTGITDQEVKLLIDWLKK